MNPTQPVNAGIEGNHASGPVVWVVTFVVTAVLLALLKQALWFAVPALGAIIVYYLLYPMVRRLTLSGVDRKVAATVVSVIFFVAVCAAMIPAASWLASQEMVGERSVRANFQVVERLAQDFASGMESRVPILKMVGFQGTVAHYLAEIGGPDAQRELRSSLLSMAAALPSLLLAPFFAYFLLSEGRSFLKLVVDAVPNAYFERTLYACEQVDDMTRSYFKGILKLTVTDAACLGVGLWMIGLPMPFFLGVVAAVLAWIPVAGPIVGCVVVVLVAATDATPGALAIYEVIGLFVLVRLIDDFVLMPLTVGRSLRMHPLPAVLLVFIGGVVAGVLGLIIVLPLAAIVMVIAGTIGGIIKDPRLRARHAFARSLRIDRATRDLR